MNTNPFSPIPMTAGARSALLVVDMQEFFFRLPERRVGLENVVANINRMIDAFDAAALPVYHVITAYQPDGSDWDLKQKLWDVCELLAGSLETEILPAIRRLPAHCDLVKTRYSAFMKTGLAERLLAQNIRRVMVTGAYTHYCVNETVYDAYEHDFIPGVITDAVISNLPAEAEIMLARMLRNGYHLMTTAEYLQTGGRQPGSER
jgi:nicotinamidase-related amidase